MKKEDNIHHTLNRVEELEKSSLKKAIPARWQSYYWALYCGVIISWVSYKGPYGFYIFFALSVIGAFLHRKEDKKGVRLSIMNIKKNIFVLRVLAVSILIGLAFTIRWLNMTYNLHWLPIASASMVMLLVFLWIELSRKIMLSTVLRRN